MFSFSYYIIVGEVEQSQKDGKTIVYNFGNLYFALEFVMKHTVLFFLNTSLLTNTFNGYSQSYKSSGQTLDNQLINTEYRSYKYISNR